MRLVVAYDGTDFAGFALNPGVRTVAGVLRDALCRVLRLDNLTLTAAGRTDRGVHARGQVVSFDVPAEAVASEGALAGVQRRVNALCGPEVVVRDATVVPDTFDARRSALSRRYRYLILNRAVPDPLLARFAWHVPEPLALANLRLATDPLLGEHDFSAFCRRPRTAEPVSLVRRVLDARWDVVDDDLLSFSITANAFCHQMVRSIVGTLVDMGRGRRRAGEMMGILRAGDRGRAGPVAPPHGLCLEEVRYPPDVHDGTTAAGA